MADRFAVRRFCRSLVASAECLEAVQEKLSRLQADGPWVRNMHAEFLSYRRKACGQSQAAEEAETGIGCADPVSRLHMLFLVLQPTGLYLTAWLYRCSDSVCNQSAIW